MRVEIRKRREKRKMREKIKKWERKKEKRMNKLLIFSKFNPNFSLFLLVTGTRSLEQLETKTKVVIPENDDPFQDAPLSLRQTRALKKNGSRE